MKLLLLNSNGMLSGGFVLAWIFNSCWNDLLQLFAISVKWKCSLLIVNIKWLLGWLLIGNVLVLNCWCAFLYLLLDVGSWLPCYNVCCYRNCCTELVYWCEWELLCYVCCRWMVAADFSLLMLVQAWKVMARCFQDFSLLSVLCRWWIEKNKNIRDLGVEVDFGQQLTKSQLMQK